MPIPLIVRGVVAAITTLFATGCESEKPRPETLPILPQPKIVPPTPSCQPYAGELTSFYGWQGNNGLVYGDGSAEPAKMIPAFDSLSPVMQALFRDPTPKAFDAAMNAIASNKTEGSISCSEILKQDKTKVFFQLHDPQYISGATTLILKAEALSTGKLEEDNCSALEVSHWLNKFMQSSIVDWTDIPFNFFMAPLVDNGIKVFSRLLIKHLEAHANEFAAEVSKDVFTVAAIQLNSPFAETKELVKSNISKIAALADEAAAGGAVFIVTPELAVHSYAEFDLSKQHNNYYSRGESLGGNLLRPSTKLWCHASVYENCPYTIELHTPGTTDPQTTSVLTKKGTRSLDLVDAAAVALPYNSDAFQPIQTVAKKYGSYVQIGYMEKTVINGRERIFNSANIYGPDGKLVYHHRKTKLYKIVDQFIFTEAALQQKPFFETPYGRASSAICFEGGTIFPEIYTHNVDVLLYSVAWVDDPQLYRPNYQVVGKNVTRSPMHVVMANWAFEDGPKVNLNVCSDNKYKILSNDAEANGSGLSYVMDRDGHFRGMLVGNPQAKILYANLPSARKNRVDP